MRKGCRALLPLVLGGDLKISLSISLVNRIRIAKSRDHSKLRYIPVSNTNPKLELNDITRGVLDTVGALVLILDTEGRIVHFNRACQELSGFSEEEALGQTPWDFLLPREICESIKNDFLRLSGGDFPLTHESDWLTRDGDKRTITWSSTATLNDTHSVDYIIGTGIDITEQANLQNRLKLHVEERTNDLTQTNQELAESKSRLARAQTIAHLGNWEWNIATGALIWSDEIYRIFGRQPQEFDPTYELFLDAIHPEDRLKVSDAVNDAIDNDAPYSIVHRVVCPDGEEKVVQEIGLVLRDENGMALRMDGTVQDITRDWHTREALIMATQAAGEASRAKSDFLAGMSHELRTPLNAILGFAEILQSDSRNPLSARQMGHVGHIVDSGNHLLKLVNEVLDLARIEAGKLDLILEDVDPGQVIHNCVALTIPLSEPRRIKIINEISNEPSASIYSDQLRLTQVLVNLLSNAVKYNLDGGSVTIKRRRTADNFLRISVKDTGIGIATKDHAKLFEMFHRLEGVEGRKVEGSGIGLATTKALVEDMAGRIGFESEEGIGSTFWVELPLASSVPNQA